MISSQADLQNIETIYMESRNMKKERKRESNGKKFYILLGGGGLFKKVPKKKKSVDVGVVDSPPGRYSGKRMPHPSSCRS